MNLSFKPGIIPPFVFGFPMFRARGLRIAPVRKRTKAKPPRRTPSFLSLGLGIKSGKKGKAEFSALGIRPIVIKAPVRRRSKTKRSKGKKRNV